MLSITPTNTTTTTKQIKKERFSWLRRKSSSWSLRPISTNNISTASLTNSLSSVSSDSIPSSNSVHNHSPHLRSSTSTTTTASVATTIPPVPSLPIEFDYTAPPPPAYDDDLHPWADHYPIFTKTTSPREEEGKESLPSYTLTIDKVSYLRVKCEFTKTDHRPSSRPWKEVYVHVCGTKVSAYNQNPNKTKKKLTPIWSYSMQSAQVMIATDYVKHRFAFRIRFPTGLQLLMTTHTDKEKFDWVDAMETSINISLDLDSRPMPVFINHRRRARRLNNASNRNSTVTNASTSTSTSAASIISNSPSVMPYTRSSDFKNKMASTY